jgi:signal transduction histidine kinase
MESSSSEARVELEAFVGGLVHALNNPLTYIQTNLTSLRRDVRDVAALIRALDELLPHLGAEHGDAAAHLRSLRSDLAMERPDEMLDGLIADCQDGLRQVQIYLRATRLVPKVLSVPDAAPAPFDPQALLAPIVERIRRDLGASGVVESGGEPVAVRHGLADRWRLVFEAVCDNARHALAGGQGRRGGQRIQVTTGPGHVIVDDDGPGVAEALRDRIFLPYFTTRPGSVGLGLAVAAACARAEGGAVELAPGQSPLGGARFVIRLPVV